MCSKNHYLLSFFAVLCCMTLLLVNPYQTAYADQPYSATDRDACITCHDDLYFLHDTGKWYCLREAPMDCVGCHEGDPTATTKEEAHINRHAHPIVNENISKCQECHPEQSIERVRIFQDAAGVSSVVVAATYVPAVGISEGLTIPSTGKERVSDSNSWEKAIAFLATVMTLVGLAVKFRRGREILH